MFALLVVVVYVGAVEWGELGLGSGVERESEWEGTIWNISLNGWREGKVKPLLPLDLGRGGGGGWRESRKVGGISKRVFIETERR